MKKYFYLFTIMLVLGGLIACSQSYRGSTGRQTGVAVSPVQQNQTIRLRGENMGNVQSIDLSIALPYSNTASLMEYEGHTNIHGSIQLDSGFRCLGGNRTPFNCEAEVQNRIIEINSCRIGGNDFQMRIPFQNSASSIHRYDIVSVIVYSPNCFLNTPYHRSYRSDPYNKY